jgi:hypothetical protein
MSFCKRIFQKEIYEIENIDLESFFKLPQEESSIMEFKSGKVEVDELYREICAFLNTEGGILIVGAPQEKKIKIGTKERKICVGDLTDSIITELDSLVRSISSNISPMPDNIKVKQLEHANGKSFIIEVPQSLTPPHQVNKEGKYYIRFERDSRPAPHGIVEALFYKRQKPNLDVGIGIATRKDNQDIKKIEFILGFILYINGVLKIIDKLNVNKDIKINDQVIEYQDYNKDLILVKGINISIWFEVILTSHIVLIECVYYCKGLQAEKKIAIIDTNQNNKFIKWFNSKQNENGELELDIYEYYKEIHKNP